MIAYYVFLFLMLLLIFIILCLFAYECKYKILKLYIKLRNNAPYIFLEYAKFAENLGAGVAAFTLVDIAKNKTEFTGGELWFVLLLGVLIFEAARYIKRKFG